MHTELAMPDISPLWTPSKERAKHAHLTRFMQQASTRSGTILNNFRELHQWSVADRPAFWDMMWDYAGLVGTKGDTVLEHDVMPGARFFPHAELNLAENLLRKQGDDDALVFWGEDKIKTRLSWNELRTIVSRMCQALEAMGVGPGDRVAAMLPNLPETVIAMLATLSLGAVWSSCSPDFGVRGVLDRFGQIEPKVFLCVDGYWYNGKKIETGEKLKDIVPELRSIQHVIVVDYLGDAHQSAVDLPVARTWAKTLEPYAAQELQFTRLPFSHPAFIMFSSGTTGVPKCIVHGAGGTLLQLQKEHLLHCDIRAGDRMFYFTTCGWMMWNWLVMGLASNATLLLYDGSPFAGDHTLLFDYAQAERATLFGTSAKFIDSLHKHDLEPVKTHKLDSLRTLTSTASPLSPESFDYIYRSIKSDLHVASISGGTDIMSCFVLGVPTEPVYSGEIQGPGLGLDMHVWSEDGKPLASGQGELVCAKAFPCMPLKFWNDESGKKYHAAYFERFDGVWFHGDFAEITSHGGFIIHGRSDATLNPGGVRIGTAELYAQVEQIPQVLESIAVGQEWDNDIRIVLFVRLIEGATLDDALHQRIKKQVRDGASPRHVPAKIIQVADIPRTKSGKITEIAVRDVVHGRPVKNKEALANPQALELYKNLEELRK
jgi:acetoacetyl-CoA synthetase